jgi:predicted ester cyclase
MATNLTIDEMKAKVRAHFEDFVNNRKSEVIRTNMTADFYDHDGPGGHTTDVSGDEEMMRQMYSRMPDLHLTIEELIAEEWDSAASSSGDSKATRSPSAGRQSLRRRNVLRGTDANRAVGLHPTRGGSRRPSG